VHGLENEGEWKRRSLLGIDRAKDFSWDRSAAALLETLTAVYEWRQRR
jgi:hypothetical protein